MDAMEQTRLDAERGVVLGRKVYEDRSGVGHCWRCVPIPVSIAMEIEAEILDGGKEECEGYVATNGLHYRW